MSFVFTAATLFVFIGATAGWTVAALMDRFLAPRQRRRAFRMLLAAAIIPYGWVIQHVVGFSVRFGSGPAGIESFGYYPGVLAYIAWGVTLGAGLVVAALSMACRAPERAAFLPAGVYIGHYLVGPVLLGWKVPGGADAPMIDNVLTVWFFVLSMAETIFLWTVAHRSVNQNAQS